jgi:hypothetical protein
MVIALVWDEFIDQRGHGRGSFHGHPGPRLPKRTPVNGAEPVWSSSTKRAQPDLQRAPTLGEVIDQAHRGIDRVRRTPHLADSFLRHAGLSVS